MSATNEAPLVHMENIGRTFGNVVALENVSFDVGYQEVIGLLGDNGAGKSTLIKVLTGVHTPTSGQIYFEGRPVSIGSPQDARELGIETVYQDLALVPLMSISRNFYLGREPIRRVGPVEVLNHQMMADQTADALAHIGIKIRGAAEPVGTLSGGERQSIAIGRAVHFGTKLLILDEPTSALSIGETRKVLTYTLEAKKRGLSVIFITHNIHHVFEVADRFTIISHGHKTGDFRKEDISIDEVSGMIMGEPAPERLRNLPALTVNTRPIVVSGNGAKPTDEIGREAAAEAKALQQMIEQRTRTRRITWGAFVIFLVVVLGLTAFYSRPLVQSDELVPPLTKQVYGTHFIINYPEGWLVERSEANIIQLANKDRNWQIVFEWESAVKKGLSPSRPMTDIIKQLEADDFTPNKYTNGKEFQVGPLKGYRREWQNEDTKRGGVVFNYFDDLKDFYNVKFEGKLDEIPRIVPLAEAIMAGYKQQ